MEMLRNFYVYVFNMGEKARDYLRVLHEMSDEELRSYAVLHQMKPERMRQHIAELLSYDDLQWRQAVDETFTKNTYSHSGEMKYYEVTAALTAYIRNYGAMEKVHRFNYAGKEFAISLRDFISVGPSNHRSTSEALAYINDLEVHVTKSKQIIQRRMALTVTFPINARTTYSRLFSRILEAVAECLIVNPNAVRQLEDAAEAVRAMCILFPNSRNHWNEVSRNNWFHFITDNLVPGTVLSEDDVNLMRKTLFRNKIIHSYEDVDAIVLGLNNVNLNPGIPILYLQKREPGSYVVQDRNSEWAKTITDRYRLYSELK